MGGKKGNKKLDNYHVKNIYPTVKETEMEKYDNECEKHVIILDIFHKNIGKIRHVFKNAKNVKSGLKHIDKFIKNGERSGMIRNEKHRNVLCFDEKHYDSLYDDENNDIIYFTDSYSDDDVKLVIHAELP